MQQQSKVFFSLVKFTIDANLFTAFCDENLIKRRQKFRPTRVNESRNKENQSRLCRCCCKKSSVIQKRRASSIGKQLNEKVFPTSYCILQVTSRRKFNFTIQRGFYC